MTASLTQRPHSPTALIGIRSLLLASREPQKGQEIVRGNRMFLLFLYILNKQTVNSNSSIYVCSHGQCKKLFKIN